MKLNWVTLKVTNLEKSIDFYTKLLNLNIAARFGNEQHKIVMLGESDGPKIELIYEPNSIIENPGNGVSIGLEISNLDMLISKLKESGQNVIGPISPNPHIRFFFIKDPDGYTVQLAEQK